MDGELLRRLYHHLFDSANRAESRRYVYDQRIILFVYFIAVCADRSLRWAHQRRNWPLWARRLPVPSYSQLMRRVKSPAFTDRVAELNREFRALLPAGTEKCVDGKPLVVGAYSKDPDARLGYLAPNVWGRGYKVHAVIDATGAVDSFEVTPLDAGEATVARRLVQTMELGGILLRGDANYDSNLLYAAVAGRGGRLLAPRGKPGSGLGHRRHHPDRLRALDELEKHPEANRTHRRHRARIEQIFGHLTNLPCGLASLPNSVRRLPRVTLWVTAKISLYHLYLDRRATLTKAA